MTLDTWLAFVVASLILTMSPGPSVLIAAVHAVQAGKRFAVCTALGDISANFLQMLLVALGLGAVIASSALAFGIIKWCGVVTLMVMGLRLVFSTPRRAQPEQSNPPTSAGPCFLSGFLVAAGNPKALVFFTAFFPQFIDPAKPLFAQMAILCPTMAALDFLWVMAYALAANRLLGASGAALHRINRVSGGLLLGAAGILSLNTR